MKVAVTAEVVRTRFGAGEEEVKQYGTEEAVESKYNVDCRLRQSPRDTRTDPMTGRSKAQDPLSTETGEEK